jgi:hypothetical protein
MSPNFAVSSQRVALAESYGLFVYYQMPSPALQSALDDIHTSGAAFFIIGQQYGDKSLSRRIGSFRSEVARVFADPELRAEWKTEFCKTFKNSPEEDYLDLDVLRIPAIIRLKDGELNMDTVANKVRYWTEAEKAVNALPSNTLTKLRDDTDFPSCWDPDHPLQAVSPFVGKFKNITAAQRQSYWEEYLEPRLRDTGGIMGDMSPLSDPHYVRSVDNRVAKEGIEKITTALDLMCLGGVSIADKERLRKAYALLARNVGSGTDGFVPLAYTTRTSIDYRGVPHMFYILPEGEVAWERAMPGTVTIICKDLDNIREEARSVARAALMKERRKWKRTRSRRQRRRKIQHLKNATQTPGAINLPDVDYMECSVCTEDILLDDKSATVEPCNHTYHEVCLTQWYMTCEKRGVTVIRCPYCGK